MENPSARNQQSNADGQAMQVNDPKAPVIQGENVTAYFYGNAADSRAESTPLNGIPHNVPMRGVIKFVGRDTELETLHREMQNRDRVIISAIAGMGGIGKTELAIQYANRKAADYPGGICWLNGQLDNFLGQMLDFARNVLSLRLPTELEKTLTTLEQQFVWYRDRWQPSGAVLLIVDDVAEMGELRSLLQKLPSQFRVLITTRRRGLDADFVELPLDVLPEDKALELLSLLIGTERVGAEAGAAAALVGMLGRLPLGLVLMGRYVALKPFLSLEEMRSQLDLQHQAIDRCPPEAMMTAQQGVRAAFELSWRELDEAAQELGRFLSLFAADEIPCSLVQRVTEGLAWSTERQEAALEALANRHMLLEVTRLGFKLHPLMRQFFALKLQESERQDELRLTYVKTLVEVAAEIPYPITLTQVAQFSPAIPHLQEIAESNLQLVPDEMLKDLFTGLCWFYCEQGTYSAAESLQEKGIAIVRNHLGEDHPHYASMLSNLALVYQAQGHYRDAEPLYLKAKDVRKQALGENHPDYISTLSNLALVYQAQGHYGDAESLYLKARDMRKQVLGEEHPYYLATLTNIASLYQVQRRYGEAELLLLHVRDTQKQVLGEDHPYYLGALTNLALVYQSQRRYGEAKLLLLHVRDTQKQVLRENHLNYLCTLDHLACLCHLQRNHEEAESFYLHMRDVYKQMLGENHLYYVSTLGNLALVYRSQGRYREAELLLLHVRDIYKQVLGTEHPRYLTTLAHLASLYFFRSNSLKFLKTSFLLLQILKTTSSTMGWMHPIIRRTTVGLVVMLLVEVAIGCLLIIFAICFLVSPTWFSLSQFVGYSFLIWLLARETLTSKGWNFLRKVWVNRNQKRR